MHHGLFVTRLIIPKIRVFKQGLPDSAYIAVSEDTETSFEKFRLYTISFLRLFVDIPNYWLCHVEFKGRCQVKIVNASRSMQRVVLCGAWSSHSRIRGPIVRPCHFTSARLYISLNNG